MHEDLPPLRPRQWHTCCGGGGDAQQREFDHAVDRLVDAMLDYNPTNRQFEIGVRLCLGLSIECVAQDCGIKANTVRKHRKELFDNSKVTAPYEFSSEIYKRTLFPRPDL